MMPSAAVPHLDPVVGEGLGVLGQPGEPLLHQGVAAPGVGRDHHVLLGLAGERAACGRWPGDVRVVLHHRLGVGDAGGGAQHDRRVELLAELEGEPGQLVGLLAVGGLQHGHLGEAGVVAVVLLVLGAVHARVVGADDHQAAPDAGDGGGEEGVGGHVQADVLHGDQGPHAGVGGAQRHLHGHLLVGRPLGVQVSVACYGLQDLGAGGARIGGGHGHAGVVGAEGDGFVAGEQCFHGDPRGGSEQRRNWPVL